MRRDLFDDDQDTVIVTADAVKHETKMAWLIVIDGVETWLPKSQCSRDNLEFDVPEWLAIEKELV